MAQDKHKQVVERVNTVGRSVNTRFHTAVLTINTNVIAAVWLSGLATALTGYQPSL